MSTSVLRRASGAAVLAAALTAAVPAGATTLPGKYNESPQMSVGFAAGRVWFAAAGTPSNGGAPTARVTSAKISSKGKLTSLLATSLGSAARFSGGRVPITGSQLILQAENGNLSRMTLKSNGRVSPGQLVKDGLVPMKDATLIGSRLAIIGGAGLVVRSGATEGNLAAVANGFANNVRLRRDKGGRLWAAWVGFAGVGSSGTTVRMQQLNATTLQPVGDVQVAPVVFGAFDDLSEVDLACATTCRVVFTHEGTILSWKPGEARATTIARNTQLLVGALATRSGNVVTAYLAGNKLQVRAGTATGAGGKVKKVTLSSGFYANGDIAFVSTSKIAVGLTVDASSKWRTAGLLVALP